ncbi:MAG: 1-acyl-sn-glycerol-3-phosphate acyltransferase [Deltaproteobacteria bacterium]|nr:1-acyl-sn-glycerol-3-phosphate acyltransferase [Deltaproteobacteria bacterium]
MDRTAKTLASFGLWAVILLTCPPLFVIAFAIWLVTAPFDRRLRVLHLYSCAWASLYTYVFPYWTTTVRDRERLRDDRAYVIVSNHQSLLDILVLFRLYRHFKWVSKEEIFRVPFIGWNMTLNRYIRIRRGDRQDAVRMMASCGAALESGSSVMIFPEGTRSLDGELREFKHGAFTLALGHGVPILPIVLDGTLDALPKHGVTLQNSADIVIQVLDPIAVGGFDDVGALRDHVRSVMAEALHRIRARRRGEVGTPSRPAPRAARSA